MAKNHPKGLIVLALTNMGERFGYYTMLAILALYLQAKFGFSSATTSLIYGSFLGLVYFLPIFGGIIADKWLGYGKTILIGVVVMFAGYLLLALPVGIETFGILIMAVSLVLISAGTGLFKGNLQALVGKIYDDPRYNKGRDMAFSIFYMFINIGAFFAPSMGNFITNAQLSGQGFYYDAAIPANFVALNDRVEDEAIFVADYSAKHADFAAKSDEEKSKAIAKAKKKAGVMFKADETKYLFNLKLAGLHQYTVSTDKVPSESRITHKDYELMNSREASPEVEAAKLAITERVNAAKITDEALLNGGTPEDFAYNFGKKYVNETLSVSYSWAFVVACISLIISILIFIFFRKTWKKADVTVKQAKAALAKGTAGVSAHIEMSKTEVRERMIALGLVFVVVIFFWMAFHQNGLTMTFFARDYTASEVSPLQYMVFALWVLIPFIVFMYGVYLSTFGLLGGKRNPKVGIGLVLLGIVGLACAYIFGIQPMGQVAQDAVEAASEMQKITPQIFQQFNPFFIILLTPVTVGLFGYLASRGKEPSAPRKIGIGMLLAAVGFVVLLACCAIFALPNPESLSGPSNVLVSPNWLIGTYLVLTVAELFLSPMGLSFVSKVAPPQYAGLMQGGWLAATAVGNLLVGVMGALWDKMPIVAFWGVLITCCLLSAAFIFSVMKRLERVTGDNTAAKAA